MPLAPELGRLLTPISLADPGGEWLRYTELYDRIQDARRADDPTLPRGIWERELKKADWDLTASLCEEALEKRSKDLYIVIWLIEAWVHQRGIAGAAAGLQLLHGLCRDFWETLYPRIDPDDPDVRSAPFEWLNDKLPIALGTVTATRPDSPDVPPYTWVQVVAARVGEMSGKKEPKGRADSPEGISDSTRVMTSVALTPVGWYQDLAAQADSAIAAGEELKARLQELSPDSPPTLGRIEEVLRDMKRWITSILDERGVKPVAPAIVAPAAEPAFHPQERKVTMPLAEDGVVKNREEAYRLLSLAAEYLLRTEPHSPTPYLVQRAVTWGRMPLGELLEEFSQDGNDLRMLRVLLGVGEQQ